MPRCDEERLVALRAGLAEIKARVDAGEVGPEQAHEEADMVLLSYIDDGEVSARFHAIERWYA